MIELAILVVVTVLVVLALKPRKPVLEQPLVIELSGRSHITLAPQLDHARVFLENITVQFAGMACLSGDSPTLFYQVRPVSMARGQGVYLLALASRGGMLYFQAIRPAPVPVDDPGKLKLLREYSSAVLLHHPAGEPADQEVAGWLRQAVEEAADREGLEVRELR